MSERKSLLQRLIGHGINKPLPTDLILEGFTPSQSAAIVRIVETIFVDGLCNWGSKHHSSGLQCIVEGVAPSESFCTFLCEGDYMLINLLVEGETYELTMRTSTPNATTKLLNDLAIRRQRSKEFDNVLRDMFKR